MIYKGGKGELEAKQRMVYRGRWQVVTDIYRGSQLVWTAIKSCFGAGYWVDDKPWLDNEGWKD